MTGRRCKILLVYSTTGYQLADFRHAADRVGVDAFLASDRCAVLDDPWGDQAWVIRFDEPEASARRLISKLKHQEVDGVVGLGDRAVIIAALVAEALELPCNPPSAAAASCDKLRSRELCGAQGVPVPPFAAATLPESGGYKQVHTAAAQVGYPCVIKPLRLSASRGVMRVDDLAELDMACERLRKLLAEPDVMRAQGDAADSVLLEQFIPGEEIAVEAVLNQGSLHLLSVFDKPDPLDGPFFAETLYVTPSRQSESMLKRVTAVVASAARALGLRHGPIHAELRLGPEGPVILEVAARSIGGLCSRVLRFGGGISLEEVVICNALGLSCDHIERERRAAGVMMLPVPHSGVFRGVEGTSDAEAVSGISGVEITARSGHRVRALPEGDSYLGFIFAKGDSTDEVTRSLRQAAAKLRFDIHASLPVSPSP